MMTTRRLLGLGTILILIGGLIGGGIWFRAKKKAGKAKTYVTVRAETGAIEETVEATGDVAPLNRVEIRPPLQGRVDRLLVEEGTRVKSGQIIAWISSSDRAAILDAARARGEDEYRRWQDVYKPTPIVAPLSGVIILKNVVVGQTVDTSNVVFAMSDELVINPKVDESDIGRIKVGMETRIVLDSFPEESIQGRVFQIYYEGKSVSNVITYTVRVRPEKVPAHFKSQMTANVSFLIQRKENATLIPSMAVRPGSGTERDVYVPGPDGKPETRKVVLGIETGEKSEVLSGLSAGDAVLLEQGKYSPQKAMKSSPLTMGGKTPEKKVKETGAKRSGGGR